MSVYKTTVRQAGVRRHRKQGQALEPVAFQKCAARPPQVSFTGSEAVGRQVAMAAGDRIRPASLELGGKGALVGAGEDRGEWRQDAGVSESRCSCQVYLGDASSVWEGSLSRELPCSCQVYLEDASFLYGKDRCPRGLERALRGGRL